MSTPVECFAYMGMYNIGAVIKILRNLGYEAFESLALSVSQDIVRCSVTISWKFEKIELIKIVGVSKTNYSSVRSGCTKIQGFLVPSRDFLKTLVLDKLTDSSSISAEDISRYVQYKIKLDSGPKYPEKDKTAIQQHQRGDVFNKIIKTANDYGKCLFAGNIATEVFLNPNKQKTKVNAPWPVKILANSSDNLLEKLSNIFAKETKTETGSDIFGDFHRIYSTLDKKMLLVEIRETSRICVPYIKWAIYADNLKATQIKIGNFYVVQKWLLVDQIQGTPKHETIRKMDSVRNAYLKERNITGIEGGLYKVLGFECVHIDSETIYLLNDIYPKILLWNYKKKYSKAKKEIGESGSDDYQKIKRECKPIPDQKSLLTKNKK
jgi:hypothetical protein